MWLFKVNLHWYGHVSIISRRATGPLSPVEPEERLAWGDSEKPLLESHGARPSKALEQSFGRRIRPLLGLGKSRHDHSWLWDRQETDFCLHFMRIYRWHGLALLFDHQVEGWRRPWRFWNKLRYVDRLLFVLVNTHVCLRALILSGTGSICI